MSNTQFLAQLFERLWSVYRQRVAHVAVYEELLAEHQAQFQNDHIAFRSIAWQAPTSGISSVARPFEALGYRPAACYHFPAKHLQAIHLEPPPSEGVTPLPKLFVSEWQAWRVSPEIRACLAPSLERHAAPIGMDELEQLARLESGSVPVEPLLERLSNWYLDRPWPPPSRSHVETVAASSQYAAWVLVHGYAVNHFTGLVNAHQVGTLAGIEQTAEALVEAGVPMKEEIEGAEGSRLRQTATQAVTVNVEVTEDGDINTMPWTYAYFELAERGQVLDPSTGLSARFEGFLGPQATQLFDMTRPD